MNHVTLIGTVIGDPAIYEPSQSSKGSMVFKLETVKPAVTTRDGRTFEARKSWHRVVLFGDYAMRQREQLSNGKTVAVEGEISYRSVVDNFGNTTNSTDILTNFVEVLA